MISVRNLTILTLIAVALVGCGASGPDLNEMEKQGHEIRLYEVFGMDCPGCHAGLQNLVNHVAGVKASVANWDKKELRVVIEKGTKVSDEVIFDAIIQANFTPGKRVK